MSIFLFGLKIFLIGCILSRISANYCVIGHLRPTICYDWPSMANHLLVGQMVFTYLANECQIGQLCIGWPHYHNFGQYMANFL